MNPTSQAAPPTTRVTAVQRLLNDDEQFDLVLTRAGLSACGLCFLLVLLILAGRGPIPLTLPVPINFNSTVARAVLSDENRLTNIALLIGLVQCASLVACARADTRGKLIALGVSLLCLAPLSSPGLLWRAMHAGQAARLSQREVVALFQDERQTLYRVESREGPALRLKLSAVQAACLTRMERTLPDERSPLRVTSVVTRVSALDPDARPAFAQAKAALAGPSDYRLSCQSLTIGDEEFL